MSLRVGLITTLNTNIGDDFIRLGIRRVLEELFEGQTVDYVAVNKHRPFSVYPRWHPLRWIQPLADVPRGRRAAERAMGSIDRTLHRFGNSRFDDVDLIVQCGAPVMWPGCHESEWAVPLWEHVVGRIAARIPVLNLAAGSAYPWEGEAVASNSRDREFLTRISGYCRLTTVRDAHGEQIMRSLGVAAPLIPCSALLAPPDDRRGTTERDTVYVNYMTGGGHFAWDQDIDADAWRNTVLDLVGRLGTRHKVAFLCHDETENELASGLDPRIPRVLPRSPDEYFAALGRAKAGIFNRLHAAVALAGTGVPSVSIGTDTRMAMVAALDLPVTYVKDVSADLLEGQVEDLIARGDDERERLLGVRDATGKDYLNAIRDALD